MSSYNSHEAERYQEFRRGDPDDATFLLRFIQGSNFLDAGCGTGNDLLQIYERTGWKGFGCDASTDMLAVAQSRGCAQELKATDLDSRFPLERMFDVIYSMDVIHHLRTPQIFIQNSFHHLQHGGYLLIGTESWYDLRNKLLTRYFPAILEKDLQRYHPIGSLIEMLIEAKFHIISVEHIEEVAPMTIEVVDQIRNRAFSTLKLLDEEEFRKGLTLLEMDFNKGKLRERPKLYTYIAAQKQCC